MDPVVVVKAFVEHYYSTFDAIQAGLANFFQQCQYNITTVDCQPSGAGGILVFVFGALQLTGEQHAIKFNKKEEFKILEHSVEELECTINVLEKKVYELDEEVERHWLIRNSLELELQALTDRLSKVDNFDVVHSVSSNAKQTKSLISRSNNAKTTSLNLYSILKPRHHSTNRRSSLSHDYGPVKGLISKQKSSLLSPNEQEILHLRKRVNDLMEEKESCLSEINMKDADIFTAQLSLEQLQQRDQLLSAQNEMLKLSVYSWNFYVMSFPDRVLNSLTQALQSSGVDMSHASISMQIDVGKREAIGGTSMASSSKDKEIQYTSNQAMAQTGVQNYTEESDQAYKRRRTGKR
ncbi:hypothetical protein REPUB_Repub19eG0045800 [Reevesia pubescens]